MELIPVNSGKYQLIIKNINDKKQIILLDILPNEILGYTCIAELGKGMSNICLKLQKDENNYVLRIFNPKFYMIPSDDGKKQQEIDTIITKEYEITKLLYENSPDYICKPIHLLKFQCEDKGITCGSISTIGGVSLESWYNLNILKYNEEKKNKIDFLNSKLSINNMEYAFECFKKFMEKNPNYRNKDFHYGNMLVRSDSVTNKFTDIKFIDFDPKYCNFDDTDHDTHYFYWRLPELLRNAIHKQKDNIPNNRRKRNCKIIKLSNNITYLVSTYYDFNPLISSLIKLGNPDIYDFRTNFAYAFMDLFPSMVMRIPYDDNMTKQTLIFDIKLIFETLMELEDIKLIVENNLYGDLADKLLLLFNKMYGN